MWRYQTLLVTRAHYRWFKGVCRPHRHICSLCRARHMLSWMHSRANNTYWPTFVQYLHPRQGNRTSELPHRDFPERVRAWYFAGLWFLGSILGGTFWRDVPHRFLAVILRVIQQLGATQRMCLIDCDDLILSRHSTLLYYCLQGGIVRYPLAYVMPAEARPQSVHKRGYYLRHSWGEWAVNIAISRTPRNYLLSLQIYSSHSNQCHQYADGVSCALYLGVGVPMEPDTRYNGMGVQRAEVDKTNNTKTHLCVTSPMHFHIVVIITKPRCYRVIVLFSRFPSEIPTKKTK